MISRWISLYHENSILTEGCSDEEIVFHHSDFHSTVDSGMCVASAVAGETRSVADIAVNNGEIFHAGSRGTDCGTGGHVAH